MSETLKDKINFNLLTFDALCDKIRNGEHFSLARYGDGEFKAILGEKGENCDGHKYFPEMGQELAEVLKSNPDYYVGLHCTGRDNLDVKTLDWLKENELTKREYIQNEVFHIPVRDGLMDQFFEALSGKNVCVIAPSYVTEMHRQIEARFVVIPGKDTYNSLPKIKKWTLRVDLTNHIVLICASMTAPLIVDYLFQQYGNTATFIDFGSSFDPYVGVKSRSFHKTI